jgi:hypothetical protein
MAQRQIRDVGSELDPLGPRRDEREQAERVEEAALVRVILDPDEVEAKFFSGDGAVGRVAAFGTMNAPNSRLTSGSRRRAGF